MSRRRTERPVERLRSSWTSTADLEETIAAMFHVPAADGEQAAAIATPTEGETPTVVKTPPAPESKPAVSETPTVPVSEAIPVTGSPPEAASEIPTEQPTEIPPVGVSETDPFAAPPEAVDIRRIRLRPVRNIQDGLTPGEFLLLTEMFKAAAVQPGSQDRILQGAGYRTLSERTGQDPKTVKRNRIGLTRKFCIQALGQNTFTEAAQYRILHFDSILSGWRRRGLLWVRRAGRSVDLMTTTVGVSEMHPVGISYTPTVPVPDLSPAGITGTPIGNPPSGGGGETPTGPVGVSAPSLSNSIKSNSSSTRVPTLVAAAIIGAFGFIDDDALQILIRKCRHQAPDATNEEIAELGAFTARRILRMRNVDNPVGLLIEQTAKCFSGEAFAIYREQREERERRLAELQPGPEDD
jgi:hypothetical protein